MSVCRRCGEDITGDGVSVYNYPEHFWFKLCPVCYEIELYSGHLDLCNLDIEGKIGERG
jgi:uncharacterized protein (DUF983 family)